MRDDPWGLVAELEFGGTGGGGGRHFNRNGIELQLERRGWTTPGSLYDLWFCGEFHLH
jgi:hypothetical protein